MIKQLTLNPATSSFWMQLIMEQKHRTRDSFNKYLSNGLHELCALFGVQQIWQWIRQFLAWRTSESRRQRNMQMGTDRVKQFLLREGYARRGVRSGCCGSTREEHHSRPWRVQEDFSEERMTPALYHSLRGPLDLSHDNITCSPQQKREAFTQTMCLCL